MNQNVLQFPNEPPCKPRTQKQDVLYHLQRYGSLTRMQAFREYGICELSSRIGELEKDGYVIPREPYEGVAKNGRKWRVTRYLRPHHG